MRRSHYSLYVYSFRVKNDSLPLSAVDQFERVWRVRVTSVPGPKVTILLRLQNARGQVQRVVSSLLKKGDRYWTKLRMEDGGWRMEDGRWKSYALRLDFRSVLIAARRQSPFFNGLLTETAAVLREAEGFGPTPGKWTAPSSSKLLALASESGSCRHTLTLNPRKVNNPG